MPKNNLSYYTGTKSKIKKIKKIKNKTCEIKNKTCKIKKIIKSSDIRNVLNYSTKSIQYLRKIHCVSNKFFVPDEIIIQFINSSLTLSLTSLYDKEIEYNEYKLQILSEFNIKDKFNTMESFKKLLDCFSIDSAKYQVIKKKFNDTQMIFCNIYESLAFIDNGEFKLLAFKIMCDHDKNINIHNIHYYYSFKPIVSTIVKTEVITKILILFNVRQRLMAMNLIIDLFAYLTNESEINQQLRDINFDFIDNHTLINILNLFEDINVAVEFLGKFPPNSITHSTNIFEILSLAGYLNFNV